MQLFRVILNLNVMYFRFKSVSTISIVSDLSNYENLKYEITSRMNIKIARTYPACVHREVNMSLRCVNKN